MCTSTRYLRKAGRDHQGVTDHSSRTTTYNRVDFGDGRRNPGAIGSGQWKGYVYEMNATTPATQMWKTPGPAEGHDDAGSKGSRSRGRGQARPIRLPGSLGGALSHLSVGGNSGDAATIDLPLTYTNLNYPVPTSRPLAP